MPPNILPVARPLLPKAAQLLPYLERIDRSRMYTNGGALHRELIDRLSEHFGLRDKGIVPVSNATQGLTAALVEVARAGGEYCVMPAWTFCASGHAARAAGLRPYFVDVDPGTWQVSPAIVEALPCGILERVGAVMAVGAFGAPVDGASWERFQAKTGIPVVIDAAAGFDSLKPASVPAVVSMHATKVMSSGEGGFVATTDRALADAIYSRINFGFRVGRSAQVAGTNSKLSEYACAVGLASFDDWPLTRSNWERGRRALHAALVSRQPDWFDGCPDQSWVTSTFVLMTASATPETSSSLSSRGVDNRRWWESGCHLEPAFEGAEHSDLPHTEYIADHSIGVPFFQNMTGRDIDSIASALASHLGSKACEPYSAYPTGDLVPTP